MLDKTAPVLAACGRPRRSSYQDTDADTARLFTLATAATVHKGCTALSEHEDVLGSTQWISLRDTVLQVLVSGIVPYPEIRRLTSHAPRHSEITSRFKQAARSILLLVTTTSYKMDRALRRGAIIMGWRVSSVDVSRRAATIPRSTIHAYFSQLPVMRKLEWGAGQAQPIVELQSPSRKHAGFPRAGPRHHVWPGRPTRTIPSSSSVSTPASLPSSRE